MKMIQENSLLGSSLIHRDTGKLSDAVYNQIYDDIISGEMPPGTWLKQDELARKYGVSQGTVREALNLIISLGLARAIPRHGIRVVPITMDDLSDIYEIRMIAEGQAWEAAALKISSADLEKMDRLLPSTCDFSSDEALKRGHEANVEFHMIPIIASERRYLIKILGELFHLNNHYLLLRKTNRDVQIEEEQRNFEEHSRLIQALKDRNPKRVRELIQHHIRLSMKERIKLYPGPGE